MAPAWWLGQAVRYPGTERVALVQALKAALAAVLSWLAATEVFQLPQPFLAPWAAVFIVGATVYRSVRSAAQQVGAVAVAVLLAAAIQWAVPWLVPSVALAVLLGLLIGQWRGFGDSGPWIGITALLLITWGTVGQSSLLVDRLVETALGAAIGLAVNGLVFPPVYGRHARDATNRLAKVMADLLREMAEALRQEEPPDGAEDWARRARGAMSLVRQAERAIELNRESRRMNVRHVPPRPGSPEDALSSLRAAWPYIEEIAQAIRATDQVRPFSLPCQPTRKEFADVLDGLAELAVQCGAGHCSESLVTRTREALDELTGRLAAEPASGLAVMVLPARHALFELVPD